MPETSSCSRQQVGQERSCATEEAPRSSSDKPERLSSRTLAPLASGSRRPPSTRPVRFTRELERSSFARRVRGGDTTARSHSAEGSMQEHA